MEVLFNRFSSLGKDILSNLDDISLATFKKSSRELSNLFEMERIYWIRIINKYKFYLDVTGENSWKKVITKTPVEIIKQLAKITQDFFNLDSVGCELYGGGPYAQADYEGPDGTWGLLPPKWSPHHIAANFGLLKLFEFVVKKT